MRQNNKRLVIFSDNGADTAPRIFPLASGIFSASEYRETQYDLGEFPNCEMRVGRHPSAQAGGTSRLFLINHFYKGSFATGEMTYHQINNPFANSLKGKYAKQGPRDIATRSEDCLIQEGIYPTFIAVDFVEEGDFGGAREQVLRLNQKRLGAVPVSPVIVAPAAITSGSVSSFMDQLTIQNISATGWFGSWGAALFKSPYKKTLIFSGMAFGVVALPTFLTFLPVNIMPIAAGAVALGLMAISCRWHVGAGFPTMMAFLSILFMV